MLFNFNRRLEDAISQRESEKRDKLDKWQEITEKTSIIIVDSRSKLRHIKEKDPHTTPDIKEQLEEIQVKNVTKSENIRAFHLVRCHGHSLLRSPPR